MNFLETATKSELQDLIGVMKEQVDAKDRQIARLTELLEAAHHDLQIQQEMAERLLDQKSAIVDEMVIAQIVEQQPPVEELFEITNATGWSDRHLTVLPGEFETCKVETMEARPVQRAILPVDPMEVAKRAPTVFGGTKKQGIDISAIANAVVTAAGVPQVLESKYRKPREITGQFSRNELGRRIKLRWPWRSRNKRY